MKEEQESVVGGIGEGRRQERWEHELGLKKGRARSRVPDQKFLALPSWKDVRDRVVEDEGKVSSLTCTL